MKPKSAIATLGLAVWMVNAIPQATAQSNQPPQLTPPAQSQNSVAWTAEETAAWAYDHSATAKLLDMERSAVAKLIDCDNEEQRAMAGLVQAVSAELAINQRVEAAADGLLAYYRIVAAEEQLKLLGESAGPLDELERMAREAERLELVDGDLDALADQRLQLEDQWYEIDFGLQRGRRLLLSLTGQSIENVDTVVFVSPLDNGADLLLDIDYQVQLALENRRDLKAIEVLCRCLNEKSLPAARELLGALVPGLGIDAMLGAAGGGLLGLSKHCSNDTADLATRRAQCRELAASRRDQIRQQVVDSILRVRSAKARLDVAQRRVTAQVEVADRARRTEELEQTSPGTHNQERLELVRLRSLELKGRLELAEAVVQLRRMTGVVRTR